jgi:hypothetical protein
MNLRNEFNRIGHLFNDGVEKTQRVTEDWKEEGAKRATDAARRVRDQVDVRNLVSAEEKIVQHVRENPALYLMAAALLIGALIAKLILESRQARHAPLL